MYQPMVATGRFVTRASPGSAAAFNLSPVPLSIATVTAYQTVGTPAP